MSSGDVLKFKKDIQRKQPEISNAEASKQARAENREYQDYTKNQTRKEQSPMPAKDITELTSEKTRRLNRETGANFTE